MLVIGDQWVVVVVHPPLSGALLAGRKLVSVLKLTKCIYTIYYLLLCCPPQPGAAWH